MVTGKQSLCLCLNTQAFPVLFSSPVLLRRGSEKVAGGAAKVNPWKHLQIPAFQPLSSMAVGYLKQMGLSLIFFCGISCKVLVPMACENTTVFQGDKDFWF